MLCPNCKFESDSSTDCPRCGIVFAKFAQHHAQHAPAKPPATPILDTVIFGYSLKWIIVMVGVAVLFGKYLPSRNHPGLILEKLDQMIMPAPEETPRENKAAALPHDKNGFVQMPPSPDAQPNTVYVIAVENCAKADSQRADKLHADLADRKIPVVRAHTLGFSFTDQSQLDAANAVMNGPLPIVYVKGRAKNNPTLDEVMAEYSRLRED